MQALLSAPHVHAPLHHWLRLLWGRAAPLAFDGDCAYIAAGAIHLPPCTHWQQHAAAAAHAATHLVFSPPRFDGAGLGPVARVLLALLEDARVEALAIRELPGLARLWRPLHTATPNSGASFEGLALRLARSLCDPCYDDPNPWVRKGRSLCFLDAALTVPAIHTPAALRQAATRLGHDMGQMRLPFNSKAALPLPAYRDDHRWMWAADAPAGTLTQAPDAASLSPAGPALPPTPSQADPLNADQPTPATPDVTHHPEWDRLIARLRPAWCRVIEQPAADGVPVAVEATDQQAARRLMGPVRDLARQSTRRVCADSGDWFDLEALVHWQLGQRLCQPASAQVYRRPNRLAVPTALWLLIDQSASTASAGLRAAAQSALALSLALQAVGISFGVAAFSSHGRHAVHWRTVKSVKQAVDAAMAGRLQALRAGGSTRLGAVLRHATHRLAAQPAAGRWVLLLSDGSPYDVDVHDPAYLPADARHATQNANRRGVNIGCLVLGAAGNTEAQGLFGRRGAVRLGGEKNLHAALRRLLAQTDVVTP